MIHLISFTIGLLVSIMLMYRDRSWEGNIVWIMIIFPVYGLVWTLLTAFGL